MKYIVYTIVTRTPEGFNVSCSSIPSSLHAYLQLQLLGANILGIDFTQAQADAKAAQHLLALEFLEKVCPN